MVHGWEDVFRYLHELSLQSLFLLSFTFFPVEYFAFLHMACTGVGAITFTINFIKPFDELLHVFLIEDSFFKHLYVAHVQYYPAPSTIPVKLLDSRYEHYSPFCFLSACS